MHLLPLAHLLLALTSSLAGTPPPGRATQATDPAIVPWQAQRPLRWGDFQAATCPVLTGPGERAVGACCATNITVLPCADAKGQGTFQVQSFLDKRQSWVRDSASFANRFILAHEQVHFDINELYARKIRALAASYYRAGRYPFGPELHGRIALLLLAKNSYNNRFDAEANADPIGGSVDKWHALVGQQLAALAAYRASAGPCSR